MKTKQLIEKHERLIEILDAISTFEKRKVSHMASVENYQKLGLFGYAKKLRHNAEIADMALNRLKQLYLTELNQIKL